MRLPDGVVEARPASPWRNLAKTLLQTAAMWGTFLLALPLAVSAFECRFLEWEIVPPPPWLGWGPFVLLGSVGLYCGLLFCLHGQGTPLPLDATTRFLVLGPYRWVRNPMAMAGIGQGVIVGWMLGSPLAIAYALLGGAVWHWLARPWEERDLEHRFGEAYLAYRRRVRNWIPALRPYPRVVADKSVQPRTDVPTS
jgi:protein-S-isoprenylcysteine O-methyltransferase Ste14